MARIPRRHFLAQSGLALAAGAAFQAEAPAADQEPRYDDWEWVRAQFDLAPDLLHFGGLYLASHPRIVREAIERHRSGLDGNPVQYLRQHSWQAEQATLRAAADYLGVAPAEIALTDSTTMGLGLLYNGLEVHEGQELLTTTHDFMATHQSLRWKATRSGASLRQVPLYDRPSQASADEMVERVRRAITPDTRVLAVTWVHSSTGVKIPVRGLADVVAEANQDRDQGSRVLLCVDGVHGFGVEDAGMHELGCDFFVAGCHKWLCGPRGTGLVWGSRDAWAHVTPTIPSFSDAGTPGGRNTPGGFHSFEHRWPLREAFAFHTLIGKARIAERVHALSRHLKDGLTAMPHIVLHTPLDDSLSAGLVCFDVRGMAPQAVVAHLAARRIVATTTPYAPSYARLAPGLLNSPEQVDAVLREIWSLA